MGLKNRFPIQNQHKIADSNGALTKITQNDGAVQAGTPMTAHEDVDDRVFPGAARKSRVGFSFAIFVF